MRLPTQFPEFSEAEWNVLNVNLLLLNLLVIIGNFVVISAVLVDRKLRTVTTNKFIASLAISDLLIGLFVMPISLYSKVHNDDWHLGYAWCQTHLVTGVFSSTASIVHLVAISLDSYIVMIWLMALTVSSTLLMEKQEADGRICWIHNPQYIVLSSLLSFFLPGIIVVYMYVKIFKKLRNHQLYMFGHAGVNKVEKKRSLPRVIIEEVRSRRGSRLSLSGSQSGSPTRRQSGSLKSERSPSQPDIHPISLPQQRWRSPTICAETFAHDRKAASKKRVSIVPDPPSMDISSCLSLSGMRGEHESAKQRESDLRECEKYSVAGAETLRQLNKDRRLRREERRKSSVDGINGVPIMAAFKKALAEVSNGRRRSSYDMEVIPTSIPRSYSAHMALKPTLSTVCDEETEITDSIKKEEEVTKPLLKEKETHEQLQPMLSVPLAKRCGKNGKLIGPRVLVPESPNCIPPPSYLLVPAMMSLNTPPLSPALQPPNTLNLTNTLKVPGVMDPPTPCCEGPPSNSSHSSYTSASGSSDTYRRISMNSFGSSLTDQTDSTYEIDSRRSSAWSTLRSAVMNEPRRGKKSLVDINIDRVSGESVTANSTKKNAAISRGKLRRIATQVTRAIRRKRRESLAIRRESRATRVVAAILMAFLMCWLPYYVVLVYRGILTGCGVTIHIQFHHKMFVGTSWLGYAHSAFNPVIYMCLNKNFRHTMRHVFGQRKHHMISKA